MTRRTPSADYFDQWYADQGTTSPRDALVQRHLGLPPDLPVNSTLPWAGLDDVVTELRVGRGDPLLDLACGRGALGLRSRPAPGPG